MCVICFFDKTKRFHITLDNTTIELKEDNLSLESEEWSVKLNKSGDVNIESSGAITMKADNKIEIGTTKTLKELFDDVWAGIEAVNDNIGNLSSSFSGLVVSGQASLADGHSAIFEPLNAVTTTTLETKKVNYGLVLK